MVKHYIFSFFLLFSISYSCLAQTTYTVTNTNDSGAGSLRQAMIDSNNDGVPSTIEFNIAGTAPFVIQPLTILPTITENNTTIDGITNGYTLGDIVIDGTLLGNSNGVLVDGSYFSILGMVIRDFPGAAAGVGLYLRNGSSYNLIDGCLISGNHGTGILLSNTYFNTIQNCIIGLDIDGFTTLGNWKHGIRTQNLASNNTFRNNVISGNTESGLYLGHTSDNIVEDCLIGTDASGTNSRPNGEYGIRMDRNSNVGHLSANNIIRNNTISGNNSRGLSVQYVINSVLEGNIIGLDSNGNNPIGNLSFGLFLDNCDNVNITGNTISGNGNHGIYLLNSQNCTMIQNIIGLDQAGNSPRPNNSRGIFLNGCDNITIGGPNVSDKNVISSGTSTAFSGISVQGGCTNILIQNNYIGTDITGTKARGNGRSGIVMYGVNNAQILDNLIADNPFNGITCSNTSSNIIIERNKIGVKIDGISALRNDQHAILVSNTTTDLLIRDNIIAYHLLNSILVNNNSERVQILNNEIFCNDGDIFIDNNSNNSVSAPVISFTNNYQISGTAQPNTHIELFISDNTGCSTAPCQGKTLIGTSTTDANGNWVINSFASTLNAGTIITATATDTAGNSSEFATCDTLSSDIIPNTISGCDFLCAGNTTYTYLYTLPISLGTNSYIWSITPSTAANIVSGQYTNQISLTFTDTNAISALITATPQGGSVPIDSFTVTLDTDCVWSGDVNNDGSVDSIFSASPWVLDAILIPFLWATDTLYRANNPGFVSPVRPAPCVETGLSLLDWGPQAAPPWGNTFTNNNGDVVDFKHVDCNGNGIIEPFKTPFYTGSTPLPPNPTDADIVMRRYFLNTPPHNGNNFRQTPNNLTSDINLVPEDYVLSNGNEARLKITLGKIDSPILDVHSIAFIVEFELGTFNNPAVIYNSHLGVPNDLQKFQYPVLTSDPNRREWNIAMGRKDLTGINFTGNDVCGVHCIITIPNFKTSNNDPIPVKVRIKEAGIIQSDGTFVELEGGSTTLYILPSNSTPPTKLYAKALLEGCFNNTTSLMETQLNTQDLLPIEQSYNIAPWNYTGTENVASSNGFPAGVVDWVLLELRDSDDPTQIIQQKAAFLRKDGTIVDPLIIGADAVYFYNLPTYKDYYLTIRHRNHLDVMSATPVSINSDIMSYDFTNSPNKAMGNNQLKAVGSGLYALHAGDYNSDGIISLADFNFFQDYLSATNLYCDADASLNGSVLTDDFNAYRPNASVLGIRYIRY